jgi:hypothetical protein
VQERRFGPLWKTGSLSFGLATASALKIKGAARSARSPVLLGPAGGSGSGFGFTLKINDRGMGPRITSPDPALPCLPASQLGLLHF